jgi:hypothetical protein
LGALSNMVILNGRRWGVPAQVCVWAANFAVNVLLRRNVEPFIGLALLLVALWSIDIYRNRRQFD